MRCPACNDAMSMARYIPGEMKVFECGRCYRKLNRTRADEGYSGRIYLDPRVPLVHQERLGEWR